MGPGEQEPGRSVWTGGLYPTPGKSAVRVPPAVSEVRCRRGHHAPCAGLSLRLRGFGEDCQGIRDDKHVTSVIYPIHVWASSDLEFCFQKSYTGGSGGDSACSRTCRASTHTHTHVCTLTSVPCDVREAWGLLMGSRGAQTVPRAPHSPQEVCVAGLACSRPPGEASGKRAQEGSIP